MNKWRIIIKMKKIILKMIMTNINNNNIHIIMSKM